MKNMNRSLVCLAAVLCSSAVLADEIRNYRAEAVAMMKRDFKTKGIATADRVHEDGVQAICNRTADNPPKDIATRLEKGQPVDRTADGDNRIFAGNDTRSGNCVLYTSPSPRD